MPLSALEASLQTLVKDYDSFNASSVAELSHTPTPLEFSRTQASNRPVVIRGQGFREEVPALTKWTNDYLTEALGGKKVSVAVSPDGKADAIVDGFFVEPASLGMTLDALFDVLNCPETEESTPPVYYLQSQNGNLSETGDLAALAKDVGPGPSFAREVFGEPPDVANVWIGDGRSVTSMHKDPYENIYLVIRGTKTFTLLPPTSFYCLHESLFPHATYSFTPPANFSILPTPSLSLPWIPVNPLAPSPSHPRFSHARPLSITLHAGDMLYLPALWFHHVAQASGPAPDGVGRAAIACNWWFDMRFDAPLWSTMAFVRRATLLLDGRVEEVEVEEEE